MRDLYFERNKELITHAKAVLKNIFLYSGAEDVSEYNVNRCLNELGKFIDSIESKMQKEDIARKRRKPIQSYVDKNIKISPTIILKTEQNLFLRKNIQDAFDEFKKEYNLDDSDFGYGQLRSGKKECVYNRVMFSRYAYASGYSQRQIAKIFNIDRTTVFHYLNTYKHRNFVYDKSNSGAGRPVEV
jgi:hypothetical protein